MQINVPYFVVTLKSPRLKEELCYNTTAQAMNPTALTQMGSPNVEGRHSIPQTF
jgi:hypothetical protein